MIKKHNYFAGHFDAHGHGNAPEDTTRTVRWRRITAFLEATKRRYRVSTGFNKIIRTHPALFVEMFFIINLSAKGLS